MKPKFAPKMRQDRRCAAPGCNAKLPAVAVKENDPFLSVKCAKTYFGVQVDADDEKPPERYPT